MIRDIGEIVQGTLERAIPPVVAIHYPHAIGYAYQTLKPNQTFDQRLSELMPAICRDYYGKLGVDNS